MYLRTVFPGHFTSSHGTLNFVVCNRATGRSDTPLDELARLHPAASRPFTEVTDGGSLRSASATPLTKAKSAKKRHKQLKAAERLRWRSESTIVVGDAGELLHSAPRSDHPITRAINHALLEDDECAERERRGLPPVPQGLASADSPQAPLHPLLDELLRQHLSTPFNPQMTATPACPPLPSDDPNSAGAFNSNNPSDVTADTA